jgi:hypothetical protein
MVRCWQNGHFLLKAYFKAKCGSLVPSRKAQSFCFTLFPFPSASYDRGAPAKNSRRLLRAFGRPRKKAASRFSATASDTNTQGAPDQQACDQKLPQVTHNRLEQISRNATQDFRAVIRTFSQLLLRQLRSRPRRPDAKRMSSIARGRKMR